MLKKPLLNKLMGEYVNKRTITGSVRFKTYMKWGKMHEVFYANIFNPITNKQTSKEFCIAKHGAQARQKALAALNDMRDALVKLGCNVSYEDMHRAPMPNWVSKLKEK